MKQPVENSLLGQLNKASLSRRSFVKWSAAAGAAVTLGSKVDLKNGIYPLDTALAQSETTIIPTGCAHNCGGRCILKMHVQDGVIVRITTDTDRPDDPRDPQLRACLRGRSYRRRTYAPDRLKTPLRRTGERGSGLFEEISWEEAIDEIVENLVRVKDTYGSSAIYNHYASGAYTQMSGNGPYARLINMWGGSLGFYNSYSAACAEHAIPSYFGTFGTTSSRITWLNSKLILMWSWNPSEMIWGTNTGYMLKLAREAGARIVVIDPRFSMSAQGLADEWIPVRPGTDCAMMAAMAYVMIDEGLVDEAAVNRIASGYDSEHMPEGYESEESFKEYILGERDGVPKTPEWAESICAVPASTIARLAREYATSQPAMLYEGLGIQRRSHGEQPIRFGAALATLAGSVGINGGNAGGFGAVSNEYLPAPGLPTPPNPVGYSFPVHAFTDVILRGKEMGREEGVLGLAEGEETLPNSIKFFLNAAGNTLINQHSNVNRTAEILRDTSLCEFIVTIDPFLTPSAKFSDIVLPACTFHETWGHADNWVLGPSRVLMPKVIEPLYDLPSDYAIAAMIADKLGIYDEFTEGGKSEEDWYNEFLDGMIEQYPDLYGDRDAFVARGSMTTPYPEPDDVPIALADFVADPVANPLPTPSGKLELFSIAIAQHNATIGDANESPAIPKYVQEWESPFGPEAEQYPLQAMGHHYARRSHSTFDNIDYLEEAFPQRLYMNPVDADARGIKDGDTVRIFNDRGVVQIPVRVTVRIMPGLVDLPQGGWYTPDAAGVDRRGCINVLTSERNTPYAFGNPQHTLMVQVEKV